MSETLDQLNSIIEWQLDKNQFYSLYATVTKVDEAKRVCDVDPVGDQGERFDIRLQASVSLNVGMVIIPKAGSIVGVTFVNKSTGFVTKYSEIDKVLIDTDLTQFNGGKNGGLVNVDPTFNSISALQTDVNQLKAIFTSWVVVPSDGGAALKALLVDYAAGKLTATTKAELTDENVTH